MLDRLFRDIDTENNLYETRHEINDSQYLTSDEYNNIISSSIDTELSLNVLNLNIRSLPANDMNLVSYLGTLHVNFDVICLTETWANEGGTVMNFFPGHIEFSSKRTTGPSGSSVATLCAENIPSF